MLNEIKELLPLAMRTPERWGEHAASNINQFLVDHASCERKAHAAAMMMVNRYVNYPELQDRMISLAREELAHFEQVVQLLRQRSLPLGADEASPYVKSLMTLVRNPQDVHMLDRILVVAVIEARSCERFCLFSDAVEDPSLKYFYENFAREESRHFPLFVSTAKLYYDHDIVDLRLRQIFEAEAAIIKSQPLGPLVHSGWMI